MKKVIKELQNVDLQGVPPLVFQSLVLATNVSKAQCILDGILARITSSNLGCPKNAVSQGMYHEEANSAASCVNFLTLNQGLQCIFLRLSLVAPLLIEGCNINMPRASKSFSENAYCTNFLTLKCHCSIIDS